MGKGSSPRNCFSNKFKDNYEDINWSRKEPDRDLVNDCPSLFRWPDNTSDSIESDDVESEITQDDSCANQ